MYDLVPRSLLVEFLQSLMYNITSSANMDSLASFQIYVSLKTVSYTLAMYKHSHFKTDSWNEQGNTKYQLGRHQTLLHLFWVLGLVVA